MFDPVEWLKSGQPAIVDGLPLRPRRHPHAAHLVLATSMGQAAVYYLDDDSAGSWMLKKFHPGRAPDSAYVDAVQRLVPNATGFESGSQRRCVSASMIGRSGFTSTPFLAWMDGTILMPRVVANDWNAFLSSLRDGDIEIDIQTRIAIARDLAGKAAALEKDKLAHRDLSASNVMIDANYAIHLIDWDSLFAPSLTMPPNTTIGTDGYTAPFVDDPRLTWRVGGDRFALAVFMLEIFAAGRSCMIAGDGSLLEQSQLRARGGITIDAAITAASAFAAGIVALFELALGATSVDACPTPDAWLRELHRISERQRTADASGERSAFTSIDLSRFVKFDRSRFVSLRP